MSLSGKARQTAVLQSFAIWVHAASALLAARVPMQGVHPTVICIWDHPNAGLCAMYVAMPLATFGA